jgi:hypothetical protein
VPVADAAAAAARACGLLEMQQQRRQQQQAQRQQQEPAQQQQRELVDPAARELSVLDAVQQHWYAPVMAAGLWQIARGRNSEGAAPVPLRTKVAQALALAALIVAAVKLERLLSAGVMRPLLNRLFGSNEELRLRLEKMEAETQAVLRQLKEQREWARDPAAVPASPPPSDAVLH